MTALVDEIRDADLDRSSLVSVNSDDLSGRAYYYYYSRPSNSSQTSTSSSGTTASSDEESSDAADDGTIKIYVNSGLFQAPYFLFYTDSSRTTSFGTNELDVSKTYEFIAANSYHPFYVGDNGYRKDSSAALLLEGDGSASDGIGRDESFTLKFASDIDLSVIDSINYFCTDHASMIGTFKLVGEPLGDQDSSDDEIIVPTIAISTSDTSLTLGETAKITFRLSQDSTDFTADDVSVSGGDLSGFEAISATDYTAVFTPEANSTENGTLAVAAGRFSNATGTTNDSRASLSIRVDTRDLISPVLEISASDDQLLVDETSTIRFTLSEASSDFTADDVTVSGGALSEFSGSGLEYSASFTPSENSSEDGVITVARGAFADAAGNANAEQTSIRLEVNTVPPVPQASTQSESVVELFVSAGSFSDPFYTFYTDAEGNKPLADLALNVDETYLFRRLDDVTSHPFYVSDQGHNQDSSSALIVQGDGSAERGIKGSESFQLSFADDIDLDAVETVDYYCSSHPSMISSFRLFRDTSESVEFSFASQDMVVSSEAADDLESTTDIALSTVDVLTGDINNNGKHDVSDAISVLRTIVGLETDLSEFPGVDPVTMMDIDGNGSIAVSDAVSILRAIVGLESLTSLVQVSLQAPADWNNALLMDLQGLHGEPHPHDPLALLA